MARAFILEAEGGLYADCDFDPDAGGVRRFMDQAMAASKVLFPGMRPFGLNNYLIAAPPHSAFWMEEYVPAVKAAFRSPRLLDLIVGVRNHTWPVLTTTGPILISRLVSKSSRATTAMDDPSTWGKHGWFDADKNSAWYTNSVSKTQQYVVDFILVLAVLGLGFVIWLLYKYVCF